MIFQELREILSPQSVRYVAPKRALRLLKACDTSPQSVRYVAPKRAMLDKSLPKACSIFYTAQETITNMKFPQSVRCVSPKRVRNKGLNILLAMRSFHRYDPLFFTASCSNR